MEKGDKPKTGGKPAKEKKLKKKTVGKEKKPAKQKQKQKQKQENVQKVKVNVNQAPAKPVRKEITRQTTYVTLDKPYALQPKEEELLTITKHVPNPPRDKSSAKVTTLVSNQKNEILQANIQEQPLQIPVPIKKKVTAKKKGLFDVPVEIYVGAKAKQSSPLLLDVPLEPEILKVIPQKKPRKLKEPKYDVPVEIFEPKKRIIGKTVIFGEGGAVDIFDPKTLAKTTEEEQALVSVTEEVTTKKGKRQKPDVTNSSTIDKSIQNSSINNNEKVQELVLAEPTVSEKKTGLIISPKLKIPIEEEEEVITERTPIPTKIEIKKQQLRKIESEMRDISTKNPLYDGLKEKRNELIDDIEFLRELKTFVTETVPKIQVKETIEEILTKIEKPDLTTAASLEKEIYDYSTNTDDANISNPNTGEKINIQNENELEEEFGLTSAQVLSYKEDYVMTPLGSVEGLSETIERKTSRGRPVKYASEEERQEAIKEQKKASALRKKEEAKAIKQMETDIEYEKFIQGDYPPDSLEEMIEKNIIQKKQNEQAFAEAMVQQAYSASSGQDLSKLSSNELNAFFDPFVGQDIIVSPKIYLEESESSISRRKEKPEGLSSDFVSVLIDKLSDNNNFGNIQSAQEPQFEFD
jgi:hypothetical protein